MVGAQHTPLIRQQLRKQPQRLPLIAHLAGPVRDVVAGSERVGVVAAQHPLVVRQQLGQQPQRLCASPTSPVHDAMPQRVPSVLGWSVPSTRHWSGSNSANSRNASASPTSLAQQRATPASQTQHARVVLVESIPEPGKTQSAAFEVFLGMFDWRSRRHTNVST